MSKSVFERGTTAKSQPTTHLGEKHRVPRACAGRVGAPCNIRGVPYLQTAVVRRHLLRLNMPTIVSFLESRLRSACPFFDTTTAQGAKLLLYYSGLYIDKACQHHALRCLPYHTNLGGACAQNTNPKLHHAKRAAVRQAAPSDGSRMHLSLRRRGRIPAQEPLLDLQSVVKLHVTKARTKYHLQQIFTVNPVAP